MPKINDEQREENKRHIQKVATGLFYENGYSKTSIKEIIQLAKMSKGRFYTYYDSKESLFFDIIHASDMEIRQRESIFMELESYIGHRLKRYIDKENGIRAKYTLEFWSSTVISKHQQSILDRRYMEFQKDIINIIEIGQRQGIYSSAISLQTFSYILMSCIDGIITMDAVLNQPITDEIIETTIKIFTAYLKEEK